MPTKVEDGFIQEFDRRLDELLGTDVPVNRFEQWRSDHFPAWLKRLWPIKTVRLYIMPVHVNCRCRMDYYDRH